MKKVKFDNRQSIALQNASPGATPEKIEVLQIDGWLVVTTFAFRSRPERSVGAYRSTRGAI
jgi:hypothetical protein